MLLSLQLQVRFDALITSDVLAQKVKCKRRVRETLRIIHAARPTRNEGGIPVMRRFDVR
jgi:hypothetical protein